MMNSMVSLLNPNVFVSFFHSSLNIAFFVVTVIALSKVFMKAGVVWWYAFIPVVNIFCLFKIARVSLVWILLPIFPLMLLGTFILTSTGGGFKGWETILIGLGLFLVSGVLAFFVLLRVNVALAKKFGKSGWFGLGLSLLPWLFYSILGFDGSVYNEGGETSSSMDVSQTSQVVSPVVTSEIESESSTRAS